jgi:fused signal recognition particle receptor
MAFFSKLKERLFRSSSKLDEGLDAIVEDGGEEEVLETQVQETFAPENVLDDPIPEPEPEPEQQSQSQLHNPCQCPSQKRLRPLNRD